MKVAALSEGSPTDEPRFDLIIEASYGDLPTDLHMTTEAIIMYGSGPTRGSTFRVDHLRREDTLEATRQILRASAGLRLPRFYFNSEGEYIRRGWTPVVETRHADFEQKGNYFEIEGGQTGLSAMLRVPIYETEPETSRRWPLTKLETITLGAAAAATNGLVLEGLTSNRPAEAMAGLAIGTASVLATTVKLFGNPFAREA